MRVIRFVQGEEIDLILPVKDKFTGVAVCLESFEGATAFFPPASGDSAIAVSGSVYDADQGLVRFSVKEEQSELVLVGDEMDYEYVCDRSSMRRIIEQVYGKLFVSQRLFP